jgi:hypothetical protein
VQGSLQFRVGRAIPEPAATHAASPDVVQLDHERLAELQITNVSELEPLREYYVQVGEQPYRISLHKNLASVDGAAIWTAVISQLKPGTMHDADMGQMPAIRRLAALPSAADPSTVAMSAIRFAANDAYAHRDVSLGSQVEMPQDN